MKKYFFALLILTLYRCQFIFPTSYLDNEFQIIEINESFYLQEFLPNQYALIEKLNTENEVHEVVLESIDSILYKNKDSVYFYSKRKYYFLETKKLEEKKFNNIKMQKIESFIKSKN